jgi:hypothetical protein
MPDRLDRAKRRLRRDKVVKKAGSKSSDPDARDAVREQAAAGDPLWFPGLRRRRRR